MAIFGNFKGTTKSEFQIGKSGTKLSTGTRPSAELTVGDIFVDAANASLQVYNNAWVGIGETLTELNVDNGTLFVDSSNDTVSIGSTASNEKLFVNGSLRLGTNPAIKYSGAYLDLKHSNGTGTVIRVRDNDTGTDPVFKVYNANNTNEVFKVQGSTVRINDAYNMPTADGTAGQFLTTDGNGTLSYSAVSVAYSDISGTPALEDSVSIADATSTGNFTFVFGGSTNTTGGMWNNDGTVLFVCEGADDIIRGVTVPGDPYDVDSITSTQYNSTANQIDVTAQNGYVEDIYFTRDGLRLYMLGSFGTTNHAVYSYTLTSAWDLTTATYDNKTININGTAGGGASGLHLSNDGTKMFITSFSTDRVHEFALSTAYDVSTASQTTTLDVSANANNPTGIRFSSNGKHMFITDNAGSASVYQYDLTSAFDISSASYVTSYTETSSTLGGKGLAISQDDTKMHIVLSGRVYEIGNITVSESIIPTVGSDSLAYNANLQGFVDAFTLPTTDGTSGQVLQTDGSGNISFATLETSDPIEDYGSITESSNVTVKDYGDVTTDTRNPTPHDSYTVAEANAIGNSTAGDMVFVSDESGGATMAFYDGSNWRRITDRAIIS